MKKMTLQELMTFARENLWNKFIITNNINTDHIYGTALKLSHEPVVYKSLKSISDKLVPYFDDPEWLVLELDRVHDLLLADYIMSLGLGDDVDYLTELSEMTVEDNNSTVMINCKDIVLTIVGENDGTHVVPSLPLPPAPQSLDCYNLMNFLKVDYIDFARVKTNEHEAILPIDCYTLGNLSEEQLDGLKDLYIDLQFGDTENDEYDYSCTPYLMYDYVHELAFAGLWSLQNSHLISKVPIEVIGYDNYESKNNKAQVFKISSEVKRILSKSEVGNLNFNIGNFSFENVPFHR